MQIRLPARWDHRPAANRPSVQRHRHRQPYATSLQGIEHTQHRSPQLERPRTFAESPHLGPCLNKPEKAQLIPSMWRTIGPYLRKTKEIMLIFAPKVRSAIISDQASKKASPTLGWPTQILRATWHRSQAEFMETDESLQAPKISAALAYSL